jgi:serine/threonine protein kinase
MGATASVGATDLSEDGQRELYKSLRSTYIAKTQAVGSGGASEDVDSAELKLFNEFVDRIGNLKSGEGTDDSLEKIGPDGDGSAFSVMKEVGRGAFAVAKLCRSKADGKLCVVKQMNVPLDELTTQERLETLNEVAIMQRLTHPNIVSYMHHFTGKGVMHIVMEYADGGTLATQIIKASGGKDKTGDRAPFSMQKIWEWFVQIVLALSHIHKTHVMHRDMKPLNIMLAGPEQRVVKLGDFGIAKNLEQTGAMASTVVGTPFYLSPELCEGKYCTQPPQPPLYRLSTASLFESTHVIFTETPTLHAAPS